MSKPNRKSPLKLLWITDPWDTLDHPRDTTLRLAQEAHFLGMNQSWCDVKSIRLVKGKVCLDAQRILSVSRSDLNKNKTYPAFELDPPKPCSLGDFNQIHYRTDPPVDLAYLHPLQLLTLGLRDLKHCELVNPPNVLLLKNEKFEASSLGALMPPSVVASRATDLLEFARAQGKSVLKPLHEAQSHGIEMLNWGKRSGPPPKRLLEILKLATRNFSTPVILQAFLGGIEEEGETRLWFIDGRLLATVKKHPVSGDFRVNMDLGSQLSATQLNAVQRKTALKIAQHLKSQKIRFAAVDLIDGYITDFNFTSPGLIPQMEGVLNTNLAKPILSSLCRFSSSSTQVESSFI